jgi:hypothetical protein
VRESSDAERVYRDTSALTVNGGCRPRRDAILSGSPSSLDISVQRDLDRLLELQSPALLPRSVEGSFVPERHARHGHASVVVALFLRRQRT